MKNTKCLFNEQKHTPVGMVSVSQLQTFMSCRKKWAYNYIDDITPRIERAYLTIGKLCHKGMQNAMQSLWMEQQSGLDTNYDNGLWSSCMNDGCIAMEQMWQEYMNSTPMLAEEVPEFDKMRDDALDVFTQAFREFEPWKYRVMTVGKNNKPHPALELHFVVPCPPTKGLHGFIDAILQDRETGFIWCTDYKFRKSLSPDEDEAFNLQNAVYAHACARMGISISGTMTWQHVNTPASTPQLLKNGTVSRAKIKTTWAKYAQFCRANDIDPAPYEEEMREKLADIEWFRETYEYRNSETVKRIWGDCVMPAAKGVQAARSKRAVNYPSLYPWNCKMCQYQSLCQAELRGYDVEAIRQRDYTKRERSESK